MLEWYEEIGMDTDPFAEHTQTIGNEEELKEIFYSIIAGNMIFLEGETGSGKTHMLREAVKKFGGRKKIIYVNCKNVNGVNVERLLKNRYGILGRMFNVKPKNMILMLDEIEKMSEKNCERIKYYYDMNHLRSVVFTSNDYNQAGLNSSIKQRINKVLKLKPLSDYEAVKVVREKIGDNFLSDRAIKNIYNHGGKKVGRLLDDCKVVLKEMANQKLKTLDDNKVDEILEKIQ